MKSKLNMWSGGCPHGDLYLDAVCRPRRHTLTHVRDARTRAQT